MGRYEADEMVAPCRCGEGTVTATRYSPDFAFGKCYFSEVTVHCDKCEKDKLSRYADLYDWKFAPEVDQP